MFVIKRDGSKEQVKFEKVAKRITRVAKDLKNVDPNAVAQKVIQGIYDGVSTVELDKLAIEVAYSMTTMHYEYDRLAVRLAISNLHKNTPSTFSEAVDKVYNSVDVFGNKRPLIAEDVYTIIKKNAHILDSKIDYDRDYLLDYFGFKTLERSYLLKTNEYVNNKLIQKIAFRPQHLWMMVSVGIHKEDIDAALETYELLSFKKATHATPTLFNAGLIKNQLSSCFSGKTEIFTFNDGVKNIEDVKIGDEVLTHKGNIKKVLQVHKNLLNNRQLFKIKFYGTEPIIVTEDHELFSISKEQMKWNSEPGWNTVNYLRVGDMVSIGNLNDQKNDDQIIDLLNYIPKIIEETNHYTYELINDDKIKLISNFTRKHKLNEKDPETMNIHKEHHLVNRFITLNKDFAYLLGVWLGDGHLVTNRNSFKHKIIRGIGFTLDYRNESLKNKLIDISNKVFGVNPIITKVRKDNCLQVLIHSKLIAMFFNENFGHLFYKKRLNKLVFNFSKENIGAFFEGLMTSDGCITRQGNLTLSMSNPKLIKEIFLLGRAHNFELSCSFTTKKYKLNVKNGKTTFILGTISFPKGSVSLKNINKYYTDTRIEDFSDKNENLSSCNKQVNNNKFVRLMSKEKVNIDDNFVYTLGVEDDHSYMVEGIIAKNCFLIAMHSSDSISGIFDTLKEVALISQSSGGIGVHIHNIRSKGSPIHGTGGISNGIIPMLKTFNETARYVDQCLTGDSLITTKNGEKKIKDISIENDEVLTLNGLSKISNKKEFNINEEIISIVDENDEEVQLTKNHPLLVIRTNEELDFDQLKNKLKHGLLKPEWVNAEDLLPNDLLISAGC